MITRGKSIPNVPGGQTESCAVFQSPRLRDREGLVQVRLQLRSKGETDSAEDDFEPSEKIDSFKKVLVIYILIFYFDGMISHY